MFSVNFGEFLSAIREPLSERRLKLVCKVFSFFDLKKEAMVNIGDLGNNFLNFNPFNYFLIVKNYDPSNLREVINKKKTKDGIYILIIN